MLKSLDQGQRQLETAKFCYFTGESGLEHIKDCIKLFNESLKARSEYAISDNENSVADAEIVKELCNEALELFQTMKKGLKNNQRTSFDTRLAWLGSKINADFYPIVSDTEFKKVVVDINDKNYSDSVVEISKKQSRFFSHWERHGETVNWSADKILLSELYQDDSLSTCSFVSSMLSICNNDPDIVLGNISPKVRSHKFCVKMFVNGCWRITFINDKLPVSISEERSLFTRTTESNSVVWPAFIEKAYFKLLGDNSYEFNGSNAGFDTYILTGWIPEYLACEEYFQVEGGHDKFWDIVYKSFVEHNLLICLGTAKSTKLASKHDFVVTDLRESDGKRELLVKNPWKCKDRSVWYDYSYVINSFSIIYLNWNPKLFKVSQKASLLYSLKPKKDVIETLGVENCPQYQVINMSKPSTVWILLTQNIKGFRNLNSWPICLSVVKAGGEKVSSLQSFVSNTIQTENKMCLMKVDLAANETVTVVCHDFAKEAIKEPLVLSMNMFCYCKSPFTFSKAAVVLRSRKSFDGAWDSITSPGGNWLHSDYIYNPQYILETKAGCKASIYVKINDLNMLFNVQIFHYYAKGNGIQFYDPKKLIYNEEYRAGGEIYIRLDLEPYKKYLILLSTHFPISSLLKYVISVRMDHEFEMQSVSTRLGLFTKSEKFEWLGDNRKSMVIRVSRSTRLSIRVSCSSGHFSTYRPKIRVNVFDDATDKAVYYCEEFDDNLYGVFADIRAERGDYVVVIERFEAGQGEGVITVGGDYSFELKDVE